MSYYTRWCVFYTHRNQIIGYCSGKQLKWHIFISNVFIFVLDNMYDLTWDVNYYDLTLVLCISNRQKFDSFFKQCQQFIQDNAKENIKVLHHWACVRGIHWCPVVPLTKGQLCGNVSMSRRHYHQVCLTHITSIYSGTWHVANRVKSSKCVALKVLNIEFTFLLFIRLCGWTSSWHTTISSHQTGNVPLTFPEGYNQVSR